MSETDDNERVSRTLSSHADKYFVSAGDNDDVYENRPDNYRHTSRLSSYEATGALMVGSREPNTNQ